MHRHHTCRCTLAAMCYSAQIYAEFKLFKRQFGAVMDIETISCMLSSAGLIPGDNDGESCA